MKPKSGRIEYRPSHGKFTSLDELHRHIAFSGVPDIDYVERLVPVRSIVREQVAWISPWYRRTPSNIDHIERYCTAAERIGFTLSNQEAKHTTVGELGPLERFKLRICLALLARPEAELLIVDDIDQLRSLRLRAEFLQALRGLGAPGEGQALGTSVLAIAVNDDVDGIADATIQVGEALSRASAQGPLHLVRERIQQEVGQ
ncbi:hypothetical protein NQ015_01170 [Corynebacterium sp. 153RC1]|nr:hypothetical protein [Corynebacterium sp. 1222RC1]MCQ9360381.1 hypothetical protein [Corynebacterium sp. 153RC1]MCQ9369666.1 hypothetical protein [Corynebacterium sp. 35RC1]